MQAGVIARFNKVIALKLKLRFLCWFCVCPVSGNSV